MGRSKEREETRDPVPEKSKAKLEQQTAFTVALLGYVPLSAFAELEQAKGIAVALLVQCAL